MRWAWVAAIVVGFVLGITFALVMGELGETIFTR